MICPRLSFVGICEISAINVVGFLNIEIETRLYETAIATKLFQPKSFNPCLVTIGHTIDVVEYLSLNDDFSEAVQLWLFNALRQLLERNLKQEFLTALCLAVLHEGVAFTIGQAWSENSKTECQASLSTSLWP